MRPTAVPEPEIVLSMAHVAPALMSLAAARIRAPSADENRPPTRLEVIQQVNVDALNASQAGRFLDEIDEESKDI